MLEQGARGVEVHPQPELELLLGLRRHDRREMEHGICAGGHGAREEGGIADVAGDRHAPPVGEGVDATHVGRDDPFDRRGRPVAPRQVSPREQGRDQPAAEKTRGTRDSDLHPCLAGDRARHNPHDRSRRSPGDARGATRRAPVSRVTGIQDGPRQGVQRVPMSHAIHTNPDEARLRERICTVGRSIFQRGLTAGSSGNISNRVADGWLLTPTDSCLGELDPARLSKLDWDGNHVAGDKPSKESVLHRAVYAERDRAQAIVHLHSTHSAAVSCMGGLDPDDCLPPLTPYFVMKIGRLPLIPYARPGDAALADAIRARATRHSAVLLANHGPVVSGSSLEAALYATEELEETAKLFLLLRNVPTRPLDAAQIAELRDVFKLDL